MQACSQLIQGTAHSLYESRKPYQDFLRYRFGVFGLLVVPLLFWIVIPRDS